MVITVVGTIGITEGHGGDRFLVVGCQKPVLVIVGITVFALDIVAAAAPESFGDISVVQQLEEGYRKALFHIIDSMLTKSKFKDFFNKNMATL